MREHPAISIRSVGTRRRPQGATSTAISRTGPGRSSRLSPPSR